jgi:hypothetical protein
LLAAARVRRASGNAEADPREGRAGARRGKRPRGCDKAVSCANMRKGANFVAIAALALCAAAGCRRKPSPPTEPSPIASAPAPKTNDNLSSDLSRRLTDRMRSIAAEGDVDAGHAGRSPDEGSLAVELIDEGWPRVDALPTLAVALREADPKMQSVAARLLHSAFSVSLGRGAKPGAVSAEVARALVAAVASFADERAFQVVPAAVHAAMLANESDALFRMLDAYPNPTLRIAAMRHLMTYGRLGVFERVKQMATSREREPLYSAFESARGMTPWSATEEAEICSWVRGMLTDERPDVARSAVDFMVANCSTGAPQYILEIRKTRPATMPVRGTLPKPGEVGVAPLLRPDEAKAAILECLAGDRPSWGGVLEVARGDHVAEGLEGRGRFGPFGIDLLHGSVRLVDRLGAGPQSCGSREFTWTDAGRWSVRGVGQMWLGCMFRGNPPHPPIDF